MNKKEFQNKIQEQIEFLEKTYSETPEDDHVERGIILGKINGLLTAKLISLDLD